MDERRRKRILGIAELHFAQLHPNVSKGKGRKSSKPKAQSIVRRTVARETRAAI